MQGGTYNGTDNGTVCAYPVVAIPSGVCPPFKEDPPWNLTTVSPPNVNLSVGLVEFLGVDQQAFTFSVSLCFRARATQARDVTSTHGGLVARSASYISVQLVKLCNMCVIFAAAPNIVRFIMVLASLLG